MDLEDKKDETAIEVNVVERLCWPGAWTVEAVMRDGSVEQAVFAGPQSKERAQDYAARQYASN